MDASPRTLGRTGVAASPLALAGFYGADAACVERAFHELGLTTFFVTPVMRGVAEGVRRLVRAGHRDRLTIVSGASLPFGWLVDAQLAWAMKSLGLDVIDVMLLSWVRSRWAAGGRTWAVLQRRKQLGDARAIGVSCHDRPLARALVDELDLDVLMCRYNAAHRGAEGDIFATLPARRPGIIAYTATRWGRLLQPAGALPSLTPGDCYRFALSHPAVDTVLCGAASFEQLADDARAAAEGALAAARLEEVRRFGDAVRGTLTGRIGWGSS
jgi:aryl-alcohol dehydrogenase-like predicted oxidoreductase